MRVIGHTITDSECYRDNFSTVTMIENELQKVRINCPVPLSRSSALLIEFYFLLLFAISNRVCDVR